MPTPPSLPPVSPVSEESGDDTEPDDTEPDDTEPESSDNEERSQEEDFCLEWMVTLDNDEKKSLAVLLCHFSAKHHGMKATESAQLAASFVGKNDKTVRRWRTGVLRNKGVLPQSKQGRYERKGVLWHLNKMATRNNSSIKGKPNMTTFDFCTWVNTTLLPSLTLEPGFPRKVGVSTCRC